MIRPTRDEFKAYAADHSVVPVWQELVADLITPVAAFAERKKACAAAMSRRSLSMVSTRSPSRSIARYR